ncbi:MAG: winged helix-turn-helix transcriptional regulator [Clostridia bacterium]|nr:winged helix-turn-helix transcriptional regulator [Clostridia bacterium]
MRKETPICDCELIHGDAVRYVHEKMPSEDLVYDVADFFKVLGDSTRMRILWALEEHELCVCDLAALLSMTKSAVSHQLRELRAASLVAYRKSGKNVFYRLADDHVRQILERAMEHICE